MGISDKYDIIPFNCFSDSLKGFFLLLPDPKLLV